MRALFGAETTMRGGVCGEAIPSREGAGDILDDVTVNFQLVRKTCPYYLWFLGGFKDIRSMQNLVSLCSLLLAPCSLLLAPSLPCPGGLETPAPARPQHEPSRLRRVRHGTELPGSQQTR